MAWCSCVSLPMCIGWNGGKLEEIGPDMKRLVSKQFRTILEAV